MANERDKPRSVPVADATVGRGLAAAYRSGFGRKAIGYGIFGHETGQAGNFE
jgi:hypothetical protein